MNLSKPNTIVALLALGSMVGLMGLAIAGFFVAPAYKEVVDSSTGVFRDLLLVAGGVKAGLSMPKGE